MITIDKKEHSIFLMRELGPIVLEKKVYKELGYPIFSDKNHTWYMAYNNGVLIGFCCAIKKKTHISFNHDYVLENYRCLGVYDKLFNARLHDFQSSRIKAVCTEKSISNFLKFGFDITKETKNYTFVQLN